MSLNSLPLTSSGKVNRKALPTPDGDNLSSGVAYEAPRNSVEQTLVTIWEDVLGRNPIGIHDNFFALGGHSLNAIRLSTQMGQQFKTAFPLAAIFKYPTIEQIANQLQKEGTITQQAGMLLSQNSPTPIFTFAPVLGIGIVFKPLVDLLTSNSLYAFDFVVTEDRLDKYYQEIKAQQATGPYTLMGYSAGTNLAFEMVKYLEAKGETVNDLILIDGGVRLAGEVQTSEEIEEGIQTVINYINETPQLKVIKDLINNEYTGEQVVNRMRAFYDYHGTVVHEGTIQSNIHLLLSPEENEERPDPDTRQLWGDYTTGAFVKYTGKGEHIAMLNSPNLEVNATIIAEILTQVVNE